MRSSDEKWGWTIAPPDKAAAGRAPFTPASCTLSRYADDLLRTQHDTLIALDHHGFDDLGVTKP